MSALLTPIRVEAGFWLILWIALAAGVGIETDWGRVTRWPVKDAVETAADFAKPVLAEPFRLPPSDQFLGVTTRPVFIVTRRPAPVAPPPEPPKPSMQKGQFLLMGTTLVPEGKFAFLLEKAGNKNRVVAEGKEINGIMVKEVTAERVVLSQHGDTEVLMLMMNKALGITAPQPGASRLPPPKPMPQPLAPPNMTGGSAR